MDLFNNAVDEIDEAGNILKRVCGVCGKLKPISEFYKNGKGPAGKPRYRRDCKECYNIATEGKTKAYRDRKWNERYGITESDLTYRKGGKNDLV